MTMSDKCTLCPRECNVDRSVRMGTCQETNEMRVARAALHFGEEPCVSGKGGSGTVFFTGCSLRCVFCQNGAISRGGGSFGKNVTPQELRKIFFSLIDKGAHNINLVTPSHFTRQIIEALDGGLPVPVIWNSSGYERVSTLKMLKGHVQVYMPDFKYSSKLLAEEYSGAPDYPKLAYEAISEMIEQVDELSFDSNGMIRSGVIVRHLVLPGAGANTRGVIDLVKKMPQDKLIFSLLGQYTPCDGIGERFPELARTLSETEYCSAEEYLSLSGIENYYTQELTSAGEDFIPIFDGTGVTS